ncbi:MAG: hydantoinase B/oxoprolinase family protein, partial [Sneathiellaceae bacterium]
GGGAVEGRDGFNLIGHLIALGGLVLPNVETYERLYPVRVRRQEFRCDSAGAGAWRGGTGCDYEVEVMVPAEHAFRGEGVGKPSAYGIAGGQPGSDGHMALRLADGAQIEAPKYGVRSLPALTMAAQSPGGGGWGDPMARAAEAVLRDVRDGLVSRDAAARVYGVALTADGRALDATATAALRRVGHG